MTYDFQRVISLKESIYEKAELYRAKYQKARKSANKELYHLKTRQYVALSCRVRDLIQSFYNRQAYGRVFGKKDTWHAENEYRRRMEEKQRKRQDFYNVPRYSPWFNSTSLTADYGYFRCDHCENRFHHSPSKIILAYKTVYDCFCGHCTNSMMQKYRNEKPYN